DNPNLSYKAKGILTYILSRPDGWEVNITDLKNHGKEGAAALRTGLRELREAHHVCYYAARDVGRITGWLIEVYEIPYDLPIGEQKEDIEAEIAPDDDFQQVENRRQVLKTLSNTKDNSIKTSADKPAKLPTPPEVKLFREVTERYPHKINFPDVALIIQGVSKRLGRDCTAEDLRPFYAAWCGKGFKPVNLAWLSWAESGVIPANGNKPSNNEPQAFDGIRKFLARQGES
ncbi:MAG: hypothetical protein NUV84_03780, partial [Candidatus Uhrbacteria bacterium]|nr:hypothetical protein [Candidatus Uhrbacteria bacterium]